MTLIQSRRGVDLTYFNTAEPREPRPHQQAYLVGCNQECGRRCHMKMSRCGCQYLEIPHPPKVVGNEGERVGDGVLGAVSAELARHAGDRTPTPKSNRGQRRHTKMSRFMFWQNFEVVRFTIWRVPNVVGHEGERAGDGRLGD